MATFALVGAVDFNAEHFLGSRFDSVIAVDGGFGHLEKIGVDPDAVIGDFDSLGYIPDHPRIERFDPHKDASDIEIAMGYAASQGAGTLYVYGCLSGRLDHTYGVLQLLAKHSRGGRRAIGIGDTFAVCALTGGGYDEVLFPEGSKGTFSVFAVDDEVTGVYEAGVEYPLEDATLANDSPLGVSNELIGSAAKVSVRNGTVLVFFPLALEPSAEMHRGAQPSEA